MSVTRLGAFHWHLKTAVSEVSGPENIVVVLMLQSSLSLSALCDRERSSALPDAKSREEGGEQREPR